MFGLETLAAAESVAARILDSFIGNKKTDMAKEAEAEKKISEYAEKNMAKKRDEYLVRGAVLVCNKGSHKRKINLPKCHGIYIRDLPVLHELECWTECKYGIEKCNITHFGICDAKPPTEIKAYFKTPSNSRDGLAGIAMGCKCEPIIIGTWHDCYEKTKIIDNGTKNPMDRKRVEKGGKGKGQSILTMRSFLICKYGGIIEPVDSGQKFS